MCALQMPSIKLYWYAPVHKLLGSGWYSFDKVLLLNFIIRVLLAYESPKKPVASLLLYAHTSYI